MITHTKDGLLGGPEKALGGSPAGAFGGSYDHIVKFKLIPPDFSIYANPQLKGIWDSYHGIGANPVYDFVLYALMKDFSESVEQAVSYKRTKGGYVENHWGTRPSIIQASGQVGLHLSLFGVTPFQVEDPTSGAGLGRGDTVLDWDPTNGTIMTNTATPMPNNSDYNSQQGQGLLNKGVNAIGNRIGGATGNLLSTANFNSSQTNNTQFKPPTVSADQAALTGTNLGFRKFRMILDLFKHNGLVFDSLPNTSIYPATFTAPDVYTDAQGKRAETPSLIKSKNPDDAIMNLRKHAQLAPGNITTSLPIQMYVKDTRYLGFFQNFNYSLSEEEPYIAQYDFTFISRLTERTGVFFNSGTAGKKPFSAIINPNMPGGGSTI